MKRKKKKFILKYKLFCLLIFSGLILSQFIYPDIRVLEKTNPKKTAFIEYRQNEWANQNKSIKLKHKWISYNQISPYLIKAVTIAEDDKFWRHNGFDYDAIYNAIKKDIKAGKVKFGGSTISQQVAKNLYLSPSKNPLRKIREAIIAWRIEKTISKKRILEIYLNIAEWGEGIFGIEAAARSYYGKSASQLNVEESVRLASVLPNPIDFNPIESSEYVNFRSRSIYKILKKRETIN